MTAIDGTGEAAHALAQRMWHVSRLATMGELAAGIAHEINQPLAAIANYAQACEHFLAMRVPDLDEARGAVREISIYTRKSADGELEMDVCDNGGGAAPEILDRMFHPFCTTKKTGTGLGLSICRTIVEAHGGTIDYLSNVPRGACFRIRLPAIAVEAR